MGEEKKTFWHTLPGLITAVATLIGAVATLLTVLYANGVIGEKEAGSSNNGGSSIEVTIPSNLWSIGWSCDLEFSGGGTANLQMSSAGDDLMIGSWSLGMHTNFDSLTYRSNLKRKGFWFHSERVTLHLKVVGNSIKTNLVMTVEGIDGNSIKVSGVYKTADQRKRFSGMCRPKS
jgi:hypothetical protein